jgi:hypothetical protein
MIKKTSPSGKVYYTDQRPEIDCFNTYGDNYKQFLQDFIPYLESTDNDAWIDIIFANKDTSKRCVIWHFIGFVGQDYPDAKSSQNLDWYDGVVCFIQRAGCEVNDGNHPDYQQATPKERSIAYLKNLLAGKELTPMQLMDQRFNQLELDDE